MSDAHDTPTPVEIDPATAAQLDAADTRESPGVSHGHDTSGPDEMSRVVEEDAEARTDDDGAATRPESLSDGVEW